jgi:hypothetical protein
MLKESVIGFPLTNDFIFCGVNKQIGSCVPHGCLFFDKKEAPAWPELLF